MQYTNNKEINFLIQLFVGATKEKLMSQGLICQVWHKSHVSERAAAAASER